MQGESRLQLLLEVALSLQNASEGFFLAIQTETSRERSSPPGVEFRSHAGSLAGISLAVTFLEVNAADFRGKFGTAVHQPRIATPLALFPHCQHVGSLPLSPSPSYGHFSSYQEGEGHTYLNFIIELGPDTG